VSDVENRAHVDELRRDLAERSAGDVDQQDAVGPLATWERANLDRIVAAAHVDVDELSAVAAGTLRWLAHSSDAFIERGVCELLAKAYDAGKAARS
jgi:hypothetical protein